MAKKLKSAEPLPEPTHRRLKGYVFDPGFSSSLQHRLTNEVIYAIRWEKLSPGPVGEYVEVIDYDPTKDLWYEAVDLNHPSILAEHGLPLSEGDPRFHQQQVYAVVMHIIEKFEKALGRKIIFSRLSAGSSGSHLYKHEYVPRLRIYPHALRQANAFYSPQKVALLFGYFYSADQWVGNNVPNTAIFTCLSADIVAHECTHALLDSMHPYMNRDTGTAALAFHEAFADIIALLQRFTFRKVVEDQLRSSKGDIYSPENLLGDLAVQFGNAIAGNRRALRSYLVEKDAEGKSRVVDPDPSRYESTTEVHERGAILVAAVFNAFARLYHHRVADLVRLASDGSGILRPGAIPEDLVKRLAKEACEIAEKLMMICIRALDFCPPVDLDFGDYLRALVTADAEYNHGDQEDMRYALLEAFRDWGLVPKSILHYSMSSVMWESLEACRGNHPHVKKLQDAIHFIFNQDRSGEVSKYMERVLRHDDRREIFNAINELSVKVHGMFDRKFDMYEKGLEKMLGMNFDGCTYKFYDEDEKQVTLHAAPQRKFQVYRCRPVIYTNPQTGFTSKQLHITFLQKVMVNLTNSAYEGILPDNKYAFRGGATLIIDLSDYKIKYAVIKSVDSSNRLKQQLEHLAGHDGTDHAALLMHGDEPFAALHAH